MSKKLKIGVNGRFFCQPFTGIGRYTLNIFPELAKLYPELDFIIAIPQKLPIELVEKLEKQSNLHFKVIPENALLKAIHPGFAKADWEKNRLGEFFREEDIDLIHLPYPALFERIPGVPVVMTVHDTIPWSDAQYAQRNWLSGLYNRATLKACKEADQIIVVSQESAKEVGQLEGLGNRKLEVNSLAGEMGATQKEENGDVGKVFERLGMSDADNYLFYMGGYDQRKNVQRLVEVFLKEIAPSSDLKLVLGGSPVLKNSLFKKIDLSKSTYANRVISTGFLDNKDLMRLYKQAWAYFSLTTREGFNLPLLEALTLGCPAIVSDLPVHHEVAGDVPFFIPLEWKDDKIGQTIRALKENEDEYNELKARTAEFAKIARDKYSWPKSAQKLGKIYLKFLK
jgi:glycosyltransferase involved in cell wall biosynthesis